LGGELIGPSRWRGRATAQRALGGAPEIIILLSEFFPLPSPSRMVSKSSLTRRYWFRRDTYILIVKGVFKPVVSLDEADNCAQGCLRYLCVKSATDAQAWGAGLYTA
jgi:hypothetical protein